MLRGLVLSTLSVLSLAVVGLACNGPGEDVVPGSPAAQATATRRVQVADVQRIIANNATATLPPAPTATPVPNCQDAIWWTDARSHLGEMRTVQGTIVATRPAPGGAALLELGEPYPDPSGVALVVPSGVEARLSGKTVCAAGRIMLAEGRVTVQVRDPATILVVN